MASILIVDDSRISREILKEILEKAGHEVVGEAVNGKEGFDSYQKLHPDIVAMDITMPVMDGLDSLRLIMRYDPNAKVVMVTAAGQQEKVVEAIEIGACEFITKPLVPETIIAGINKVLNKE